MRRVGFPLAIALIARADDLGLITDDEVCAAIATPSDTSYWDAVTSCGPCVRKGCGYCLSTLQCQGGDERGGVFPRFSSALLRSRHRLVQSTKLISPRKHCPDLTTRRGSASGPRAGAMPCPSWVWADDAACPVIPECNALLTCGECATHEMCAWCANDQKCMVRISNDFFLFSSSHP